MASTYSPLLKIELIGTGEQSGTWGVTTNTNLGTLIEQSIAGTSTVDVTSGNITLTSNNGASDQARCMILNVTGTPGTPRNVIAPSSSKVYVVFNASNAAVTVKGSATTGITIAAGGNAILAWNGSDFVQTGGGGGDVGEAGGAIIVNKTTASESYTFPSGTNGFSVGPITVSGGVAITVASGQRWVVI
jgi:hypothetical protein